LQRLVQPPQQIGRKVHIGGLREDPAKLARELKLAAASPAPRQVLLDQGSVGLVDGAVEYSNSVTASKSAICVTLHAR
jgi:hypothetical protein